MTDKIASVMDAEKWQRVLAYQQLGRERGYDPCAIVAHEPPEAVMAIGNAALPDDDPRKITRKALEALQLILGFCSEKTVGFGGWCHDDAMALPVAKQLMEALASYLPCNVPESP